ncbi:hypothetical protein FHG87_024066 [Trinorchestia longiramus]|nr:hypothetical protein FHG87_024066 [Trinorchestia longiramus]
MEKIQHRTIKMLPELCNLNNERRLQHLELVFKEDCDDNSLRLINATHGVDIKSDELDSVLDDAQPDRLSETVQRLIDKVEGPANAALYPC